MDKPLLFRFHRGGLDEAMQTVIEVESLIQLKSYIKKDLEKGYLFLKDIKIEPYVFDHRIGWDTHIVIGSFHNDVSDFPVGFLNRKPDESFYK